MGKTNRDMKKFQSPKNTLNPEAFIKFAEDVRRQPSEPKKKNPRSTAKRQAIKTGW